MNKRILLIEDELFIREMYEIALKQAGYQIDPAEDGEIAYNKLSQPNPPYDLILLDIMLPKMDGISVLRKIKQPDAPAKQIPVFLLTNLGMENLIKEAMELGADQYLIKSNVLPQNLIDEVNAFFQQAEALNTPTPTPN